MWVVERNIIPRVADGTNGCTVQFVYEDGQQAWIEVSDEDSAGMTDEELFDHAEAMMRSAAQQLSAENIADNSNSEETRRTPEQPEGPVPDANPLLEDQDEDANIVGLKGEGIIEP